jgi:hypothetical protein
MPRYRLGQMIFAIGPKGLWTIPSAGVGMCPPISVAAVDGLPDAARMTLPLLTNSLALRFPRAARFPVDGMRCPPQAGRPARCRNDVVECRP